MEPNRPDFRALLGHAALSVSQAGYNTALDVLAAGVRAIFVPFAAHDETEQTDRARALAARGLATVIAEHELTAERLAATVAARDGCTAARSSGYRPRRRGPRRRHPARGGRMQALTILERAFDAAADEGRAVAMWWRDDDAVRVGPRLERTVALAERTGARIALAVIPADADVRLLAWCDGRAHVLQHGAAHRNHQRTGKKAELGDARPVEEIVEELVLLRGRLTSPSLVPVMVPPWNRMRPDLAAWLSDAGYCGLSQFGGGAGPRRSAGWIRISIRWTGAAIAASRPTTR